MARGCVRCTWGPSLVPKAVPSRVCVYSALRKEVSGGGQQAQRPTATAWPVISWLASKQG